MIETFEQLLTSPGFVINMDKCPDRMELSMKRIANAGFTNVQRWRAVDAKADDLTEAWKRHGSPKFNPTDVEFVTYTGKQGCMLSHLDLWQHIIKNKIEYAIVFEDDIDFHCGWKQYAAKYFEVTPKDFDLLYLGSQMEICTDSHITRVPVFCTHAYVITLTAAQKLYRLLLDDPRGVSTIDCMLIDHMNNFIAGGQKRFEWYVWNARMLPDPNALLSKDWAKRNSGLVFQDVNLGTFVRPW